MMILRNALFIGCLLSSVLAGAADSPQGLAIRKPCKLTAAESAGPIFSSKAAVKLNDPGDGPVTEVVLLRSRDGRYKAGLYEAGASDQAIESYPTDEFIYVLQGAIKLTSADGTVIDAKAGESLSIPEGWKGRWTTSGYKKYFVIYTAAAKKS